MTRLETWLDQEIAVYEAEYGQMAPHEQAEFRQALSRSLHAEQLKVADAAGDLGDEVLIELKKVSDRVRDNGIADWFRRHWFR